MGGDARVNEKYNLSWVLPVDPGFVYLVRLHFCEIQSSVTRVNELVFSIYLDNQTAEAEFDLIRKSGGRGSAVYSDYIVIVRDGLELYNLWLELHPYTAGGAYYVDSILNGLEIFKLSSTEGNLAGPNRAPVVQTDDSGAPVVVGKAGAVISGIVALVIVSAVAVFAVCRNRKKQKPYEEEESASLVSKG